MTTTMKRSVQSKSAEMAAQRIRANTEKLSYRAKAHEKAIQDQQARLDRSPVLRVGRRVIKALVDSFA